MQDRPDREARGGWPRPWTCAFALPGGAFVVTLLVFLPFARIGVDPHHDGIMLKPAMDVLSGQRLFTDTFSQYGVLATYLQVAFLAVFGKTLFAIKLGTVLMYAAASAFLTAAWRRSLPASLVVLSYLLWLSLAPFYEPGWALLPWSSVYALTFQSASLYFLLRAAEAERPGLPALACGVTAALVFWCRFPVGVFLAGALVISYVALRMIRPSKAWRRSVLLNAIGGGLAVHLGFLAHLVASGTLGDWFLQTVKWPALWTSMHHTEVTNVVPGPGGKLVSGLFVLKYFDTLLRSYNRPSAALVLSLLLLLAVELVLLLAASVLVAMLGLALGRAVHWRPGRRTREALLVLREQRPLLACFGALALFLWLAAPPAALPRTGAFLRGLSWVYPWEFLVPVFVLAATVAVLLRWPSFAGRDGRSDAVRVAGTLCAVVALASWAQYYPIADPRHLFWGVAPGLGAFVFFLHQVGRARTRLVALGVALLALPLVGERVGAAREKLCGDDRAVRGRSILRGMRVPPAEASGWEALLRAIDAARAGRGDVAMLIEGEDAIYATLVGDLRNCSPFYIDWAGLPRGDDFPERRRRFIAGRQPLIFVPARNAARVGPIVREFRYVVLARIDATGDLLLGPAPPDQVRVGAMK